MSNSVVLDSRDTSSPKNATMINIYSSKTAVVIDTDKFVSVTRSVKFLLARDTSSPKNATVFWISAMLASGTDAMHGKHDVFGNSVSDQKHRGGIAG